MKVFSIIGYTNSGKTSTLLEVIKELVRRGKTVHAVKAIHIEGFSVETEGKDSWLHREAGASRTATRSNVETTIMFQKALSARELIPFFDADYLVLEGFSSEKKVPKVLCSKNLDDLKELLDDTIFAISGVISNEVNEFQGIRAFNSQVSISELVDLIERNAISSSSI
ncbi:MAG: molybdopterin-guanine dinucleotide biosynthesis protein B [Candidatus Heimdallarchaeota archaeon]|nr:molybdopterin-guanine dinucleotide biosynthesis protein B [Candidatus Heimdallarchaeota archaeon]MBY8995437.1 molybdopterin-guanine dinucleotide biosynthesis protein B [Candidatus Heimdallarchaeota archaeon]